MIVAAVDSVFNGSDDSDITAVSVPLAYLRLLLLVSPESVSWLDANYDLTAVTSEQEALIAYGLQAATEAVNNA